MRKSAPINGGSELVKRLDEAGVAMYGQVTLPERIQEGAKMTETMTTGEEIDVGAIAIRFLVEGGRSGGTLAVFEFDVPAGAKVAAAHSHDAFDETIYGLEGTLTWTVSGRRFDVGPGEAVFIPRGAVHQFDNVHDLDARAVAIATPGLIGPDFFREAAAVLEAAAGGPPDPAAMAEAMRRHGLTPAPPT
jgi:quercetin dioxygenase-like cupin family protein